MLSILVSDLTPAQYQRTYAPLLPAAAQGMNTTNMTSSSTGQGQEDPPSSFKSGWVCTAGVDTSVQILDGPAPGEGPVRMVRRVSHQPGGFFSRLGLNLPSKDDTKVAGNLQSVVGRDTFIREFVRDMALFLNVSRSRVRVQNIRSLPWASVYHVLFDLAPPSSTEPVTPDATDLRDSLRESIIRKVSGRQSRLDLYPWTSRLTNVTQLLYFVSDPANFILCNGTYATVCGSAGGSGGKEEDITITAAVFGGVFLCVFVCCYKNQTRAVRFLRSRRRRHLAAYEEKQKELEKVEDSMPGPLAMTPTHAKPKFETSLAGLPAQGMHVPLYGEGGGDVISTWQSDSPAKIKKTTARGGRSTYPNARESDAPLGTIVQILSSSRKRRGVDGNVWY